MLTHSSRPQPENAVIDATRTPLVINNISRTHYAALDGLRGLAILLVMFFHFGLAHKDIHSDNLLLQFMQFGWMGVDLFFVLSGFLITSILVETKASTHYFRNFLARRFLRIWPLYYAVLILLFVVAPLVLNPIPEALQDMNNKQAWFWLYAANWLFAREGGFEQTSGGYFWSLAVEEQFYLVWPIIVYYFSNRNLMRLCALLFAVSFISRAWLLDSGLTPSAVYVITFCRLEALVTGAALSLALRSESLSRALKKIVPITAATALAGVVAVRIADGDGFFYSRNMALYGYSLIAVMFGCLCAYSLQSRAYPPWHGFLTSRPMLTAGKYSYALYIAHVPVATLMAQVTVERLSAATSPRTYLWTYFAFLCGAFVMSFVLAALSWHLFEKRILALKKYFNYAPTGR